jgi:diguanylate cyclase (GGDEF)-like protein
MTDTALTPDEQARFDTLYGTTPTAAEPDSPGVFAGAYKGLAGIPSGLAGATLSVASAATSTGGGYQSPILGAAYGADMNLSSDQLADLEKSSKDYFISSTQGRVHQSIENLRQSAADLYRPDPQTTGFVGNTLFGAADVLTRVAVGNVIAPGAGLGIAAGTTGFERTADLEAQGVDPATAMKSGVLTGGSLVAMGGVSSFGSSTLARVLSGAGSNVAFGAATRGLDSALLEANGYHAQAEQQKWSDGAAILADGIIGGAFHLLPRARAEAPIPADHVDAALTAKSSQNVSDLAPGVPADPRSASAHVDALDTAQAQLMDGQPVAVDPVVRDANFVPRPEQDARPLHEAMADAGVPQDAISNASHDGMPAQDGYLSKLNDLRQRRQNGENLTPAELSDFVDLQERDRIQAKVAGEPIRGVLNMAGRTEAESAGKLLPVQVFADADNFKSVNDTLGHDVGDTVIRQMGEMYAAKLGDGNVFHRGGDEFVMQGKSPEEVSAAMERVRERLAGMDLEATLSDGSVVRQRGVGFSYGQGESVKAAEANQYADKQRRKDAGLRHDRRAVERPAEPADTGRVRTPTDRRGQVASEFPAGEPRAVTRGAPDAQTSKGSVGAAGRDGSAQRGDTPGNDATNQRNGLDPARDGEVALAREIVAEHPAEVLGDGTTIADAMRSADEKYAEAVKQGDGIQAAIACFLRFGAGA